MDWSDGNLRVKTNGKLKSIKLGKHLPAQDPPSPPSELVLYFCFKEAGEQGST